MELEDELYDSIMVKCESGDGLVEEDRYSEAKKMYLEALELIPEPRNNWEASTWVYTALGDACFFEKDFTNALNYFFDAMNCPDGIANPFILLRIGQCFIELNDFIKGKEYLLRCYMFEGYEIFEGEDIKYFNVIKSEV